MNDDRPFWRSGSVLLALAALVTIVVADAVFRHTGGKPADFTLFLGRFHPLVVHLPIGFVLLVGAAEAATFSPRLRARIDPAVALALPLLVLGTATAFLLGHLLARSGDFAPGVLNLHRRIELFAAVGICLCPLAWHYQAHSESARARWMYRGLLGVSLGVLTIGAHFGGTLTRGDTYLSRYAPEPLKKLLGGGTAPAASASAAVKAPSSEPKLFADVIQPILSARCVSCHGEEKVKGGLRLDSLAKLQKGGEDGAVVTPGNPSESPLLERVLLPASDDDHMPPEGKPGLTPAEIAAVRFWIERGATDTLLVRDLLVPEDARSLLEHALSGAAGAKTPTTVTPKSDERAAAPSALPAPSSSAPATPEHAGSAPHAAGTSAPKSESSGPKIELAEHAPATAAHAPSATPTAGTASAAQILANKCVKCHGPTKQKNKLRVDSWDALLQGGRSGPAVVPGNPAASLLVQRLKLDPADDKHMPPAKEPQLTPIERVKLEAWIQALGPGVVPAAATHGHAQGPRTTTTSADGTKSSNASTNVTAPSAAEPDATPPTAAGAAAPASTATENVAPPPTPTPPSRDLLASLPSRLALYPSQIAPLFHARCAGCHGGKTPAGSLAVDDYAALLKGGDTAPAVTPGKPEESLLIHRIHLPPDDDEHMPPANKPQLTPNEIALVDAWVAQDGSNASEIPLAGLPGPAVEAIAAHPPARAETDVARAKPEARAGGCGACTVSSRDHTPLAAFFAAVLACGWSARRRARPSRLLFRYR